MYSAVFNRMRLVKQHNKLPILNFDKYASTQTEEKRHGDLLPSTIRACICGSSGSGKTNILLSLLTHPNGVRFKNIYIYGKSLQQPKYKHLFEILKPMKNIGYYVYNNHEEILKPEEAKENSVIIFDDIVCSPQSEIRDYFCMARHRSIDCFYLSQTYSKIPKQLIRDNCNILMVLKQDLTNLKHIYNDHVNTDFSFENFRDLCNCCWDNRYGFLVIDKDADLKNGRYRKGFDCFIIP